MSFLYAQGDLLIERVADIPVSGTPVGPGTDGATVLLEGETTGHRHAIHDRVTMFRDDALAHDIPNGLYVGHLRVDGPAHGFNTTSTMPSPFRREPIASGGNASSSLKMHGSSLTKLKRLSAEQKAAIEGHRSDGRTCALRRRPPSARRRSAASPPPIRRRAGPAQAHRLGLEPHANRSALGENAARAFWRQS